VLAEVILREDRKLSVEGSITIDNVVSVAARGAALLDRDSLVIDLTRVTEVDSSAVSLLLEWRRAAARYNRQLRFANLPQNLQSLVRLYGVSELMNLEAADKPVTV
jgi:phospholipid transport system transporter-binding protein